MLVVKLWHLVGCFVLGCSSGACYFRFLLGCFVGNPVCCRSAVCNRSFHKNFSDVTTYKMHMMASSLCTKGIERPATWFIPTILNWDNVVILCNMFGGILGLDQHIRMLWIVCSRLESCAHHLTIKRLFWTGKADVHEFFNDEIISTCEYANFWIWPRYH